MSSQIKLNIFLTGATGYCSCNPHTHVEFSLTRFNSFLYCTGYIGGSILWRLLHHKDVANFRIKALIRDAAKAKRFSKEYGVEPVIGSLSDLGKLESQAAEADYVITTVSANSMMIT